ncbi:MAG: phage holin [Thermaerobacter sp.]|nr:phage holin [Thermaerobacter sp.]
MPTLHAILTSLLTAGAFAALGFLAKYLAAHTNSKAIQTLATLASSAVPFVERAYGDLGGSAKMAKAVAFVDASLKRLHIPLAASDIEAAIEKAYAEATANGLLKPYAPAKNAKKAADKPAPAPVDPAPATPPATPATPAK